MSFVLAVLTDENVEDPMHVVGVNLEQVAEAVLAYYRAAQPMGEDGDIFWVPVTTGRGSDVPSAFEWLLAHADDCPDITVAWLSTEPRDRERYRQVEQLMVPVHFHTWCADNLVGLRRAHTPWAARS